MSSTRVATFADVMSGHEYVEIHCFNSYRTVRKLTLLPTGQIEFDCTGSDPKLLVDPATPVSYEAWTFDRGNLLFTHKDYPGKMLKLCTEMDYAVYPCGTKSTLIPVEGGWQG